MLRRPMASDSGVSDPQRLQRVLGAPELGWLIDRIRPRLGRHGQGHLLAQAAAVLERLPAGPDEPAVLLPALAEAVTGDTQALAANPLAGLVLRALAFRERVPVPSGPEAERALWIAA